MPRPTVPEWPTALRGLAQQYRLDTLWVPSEEDLGAALAHLQPRTLGALQPPLVQLIDQSVPPTWLRLTEAATAAPRPVTLARLVGALTRLAADEAHALVINIGSDGAGRAGISVGLPPHAAASWSSGLATDLLWEQGPPYGWRALAGAPELALIGTAVPSTLDDQGNDREAPASLDLILAAGSSLGPWSLDLVLTPLQFSTVEAAQNTVMTLLLKSAQAVSQTTSVNETVSATFDSARGVRVVKHLEQWDTLTDECRRIGGWDVDVRVRALHPGDLLTMTAAFQASLGDVVHVSHPKRRQAWSRAAVQPTAPGSTTWLSSRDVADLLLFAGDSVGQVQARRSLAGGRMTSRSTQPLSFGTWLGTSVPAQVGLQDLSAHAFIAGITGSGKSTTTRALLAQLANDYDKPFLVIDPAKTDYADFGRYLKSDLRVVSGADLRMNVLRAWPGRPADQHIARVSGAFRGSFSMPSPVPYVASILLEELGREALTSEVTLHDAWSRLDSLIEELNYRGEIEDNIRASLGLRLRLLLQPSRADRVASLGAVPTWLTERPTVIQLGDVADEEERNFIASMLVLYVSDAARARGLSSQVQHLLVLEEAHRLMPEPRATGVDEGDAGSVSAKLMAQLLAEIRAYGESLIVIDQSPAAVSREVLRNTNVKLVHRVVDREDQRALGGAIGLDEEESQMLGSLGVGRALISSRNLIKPQTAAISSADKQFEHPEPVSSVSGTSQVCHNELRTGGHHAAERHGREMELLVGLWSIGSGSDLRVEARAIAQQDPEASPSCLIRVGIRRYTRTLARFNYLGRSDTEQLSHSLWTAAVTGSPAPPHPRSDQRPYPGCVVCPDPCMARGVVGSRSLLAYRRGQVAINATSGPDQGLASILETSKALGEEVGVSPITPLVIICVAVHLGAEARISHSLIKSYPARPIHPD